MTYTPNKCPKCGAELMMESNEYNGYSDEFIREVYCDNPDCEWQGGIEHYKIISREGFTDDGYCAECADPDNDIYEYLEINWLDEGDDFDCEHIYLGFKCPECDHKENVTAKIEFAEFEEGATYSPIRMV